MARSSSVIEINGSRYDAVTGQLVGAAKRVAAQVKKPAGGVIDGMIRKQAQSIASSIKPAKTAARPAKAARPSYNNPVVRRQPQRSQTLMRSLVSKPTNQIKRINSEAGSYKARVAAINPARALHAKTIGKDHRVERYGKVSYRKPLMSVRPVAADRAVVAMPHLAGPKSASVALPGTVGNISHQQLERLLDHALMQADAHKLALKARAKGWRRVMSAPKWLSIGATSLALILVAGFFAWQNVPQVSMRVADAKAHVSASVPSYTPTGYSVAGPIKANDAEVTVNYKAGSQVSGSYSITQQASNWDSSSVAANAVPGGTQVQTSQVNGTTVYIYGQNNNAAWVNHGVLFNLQDKANLNSDQILKIANGL